MSPTLHLNTDSHPVQVTNLEQTKISPQLRAFSLFLTEFSKKDHS